MADLKNMTGTEAFQLAKDESAITIEEIAERLTVSPSVIKRYLNAGGQLSPQPGNDTAPLFNTGQQYPFALAGGASRSGGKRRPPRPKQDRGIDLRGPRRAALGNVQRILAETQVIVPHNARKLRSALNDVITECRVAKESLQPLAARKDLAECTHILCMKKASFDKENLFQNWRKPQRKN